MSAEKLNTLKGEHLAREHKPITVCIGSRSSPSFSVESVWTSDSIVATDYYASRLWCEKYGIANAGLRTYVISPINAEDKFSDEYIDCTGLLVVGRDKETNKEISFISHQDPMKLFPSKLLMSASVRKRFSSDLTRLLKQIKSRCVQGSVDAVFFGGNYLDEGSYREKYRKQITLISQLVSRELGFVPAVCIGPKMTPGSDRVYFETQKRRMFLVRPEAGDISTESYLPDNLDVMEDRWRKVRK